MHSVGSGAGSRATRFSGQYLVLGDHERSSFEEVGLGTDSGLICVQCERHRSTLVRFCSGFSGRSTTGWSHNFSLRKCARLCVCEDTRKSKKVRGHNADGWCPSSHTDKPACPGRNLQSVTLLAHYLLLVMTIRIIAAASFLSEERDAEYQRRREGTMKRLQEKEQKKARQRQALEGGADLVIDLEFGDLMEPHVRLGFSNTAFSFPNCLLFPSAHQAALSFQTDQECEMHLNCFLSFPTNKTTCLRRCFLVRPDSSGTQVTLQASFLPRDESIVCTLVLL